MASFKFSIGETVCIRPMGMQEGVVKSRTQYPKFNSYVIYVRSPFRVVGEFIMDECKLCPVHKN